MAVCGKCGDGEGTIAMGTSWWCQQCRDELADKVRSRDMAGRQTGAMRPDFGGGWAELECNTCGYGWVGPIGEACQTCLERSVSVVDEQHDLALRAPE